MIISRRKFIKAGIVVAACAGLPLKDQFTNAQEVSVRRSKTPAAIKALPGDPTDILSYYNKSTFAPYVNTEFSVRLNASKVRRIKLVEVKDYAGASGEAGAGKECFSLFFTAPSGRIFPQDTYEVEHAALGKFMLFIVPTGMRTRGEQYFEAAFNRCDQSSADYRPPITIAPSSSNPERFPISIMTQESPTVITPTRKPRRTQID